MPVFVLIGTLITVLFVLPFTTKVVWPALSGFFNFIWTDPTERAAKKMLKKMGENSGIPELMGTDGELEIIAALHLRVAIQQRHAGERVYGSQIALQIAFGFARGQLPE